MSKANRLREYKKLKAENRLSQDDGSLEKEFGKVKKKEPVEVVKENAEKNDEEGKPEEERYPSNSEQPPEEVKEEVK